MTTSAALEEIIFPDRGHSEEVTDRLEAASLRQAQQLGREVRYLNTSESTVEKWETGAKRPSGMALKLLALVEKHGLQVLA